MIMYLVGALVMAYVARNYLRALAKSDASSRPALLTQASGMAALVAAALLLSLGRIALGAGLAVLGFWCLGTIRAPRAFGAFWPRGGVGASRIRSAMIEMEYDQATQVLRGAVLAGEFEGQQLDQLTRAQCLSLYSSALHQDAGGARLLEVYFDRRFPGWRATRQGKGYSGAAGGDALRSSGPMTQEEAYQVLGLRHGAGRQDIVRAHRSLMKQWHPDHGGSTDVAARVNEAKDVLLRLVH